MFALSGASVCRIVAETDTQFAIFDLSVLEKQLPICCTSFATRFSIRATPKNPFRPQTNSVGRRCTCGNPRNSVSPRSNESWNASRTAGNNEPLKGLPTLKSGGPPRANHALREPAALVVMGSTGRWQQKIKGFPQPGRLINKKTAK